MFSYLVFLFFSIPTSRLSRSIMRTRAQTLGHTSSPSRSHSPASPHVNNCVRPHNVSSGPLPPSSSSSSSVSSSIRSTQKHRQHHADLPRQHPNMPRFDSSLSRVSCGSVSGSGPSQSLPRSLVAGASGSLNGRCLERFAYRLADS